MFLGDFRNRGEIVMVLLSTFSSLECSMIASASKKSEISEETEYLRDVESTDSEPSSTDVSESFC